MVLREAQRRGLSPGRVTSDGRADLIAFDEPVSAVQPLRTTERVFRFVADVADLSGLQAHTVAARTGQRPVRLVVRVKDESRFTRRDLRRRVQARLGRLVTDREGPDVPELWVLQTKQRRLWIGIRVARASAGRAVERPAALRGCVAAAMVELVVASGLVVDPCCGAGTIPLAAVDAIGGDLSWDAVTSARANGVRAAFRGDARRVPIRDNAAVAVVTNLPFGRQYLVQGSPVAWYRRVLQDALRVAPQAVVLAAPTTPFRQALGRLEVDLAGRHDLTLLGNQTSIWDIRRRNASPRGERR